MRRWYWTRWESTRRRCSASRPADPSPRRARPGCPAASAASLVAPPRPPGWPTREIAPGQRLSLEGAPRAPALGGWVLAPLAAHVLPAIAHAAPPDSLPPRAPQA